MKAREAARFRTDLFFSCSGLVGSIRVKPRDPISDFGLAAQCLGDGADEVCGPGAHALAESERLFGLCQSVVALGRPGGARPGVVHPVSALLILYTKGPGPVSIEADASGFPARQGRRLYVD